MVTALHMHNVLKAAHRLTCLGPYYPVLAIILLNTFLVSFSYLK